MFQVVWRFPPEGKTRRKSGNSSPPQREPEQIATIMNNNDVRCPWPVDELYVAYHDTEWGVPVHDDRTIFEYLILEGAQAGLSWHTVLKKRENYRAAFDQFDPQKVARSNAAKLPALVVNPGIIRNRLKIAAAVRNAKAFL